MRKTRKRGGESLPSWLKEHIKEQNQYFEKHPEEKNVYFYTENGIKHSPRRLTASEEKWFPRMTESEKETERNLTGNFWGNPRSEQDRDAIFQRLNNDIHDNRAKQSAHNRREAEKDAARSAERKKHWLVRTFNRWTRRQVSAKRPFHFTARQKKKLW
jgi:hypothetical protein